MKITDIKIAYFKSIEYQGELEPAWSPGQKMKFDSGGGSAVEIHTDEGLKGIGPAPNEDLLDAIKNYLIGKDPLTIERHYSELRYRIPGMPYGGTAGIDIALWDIVGKLAGLPLHKLWGGNKSKITPYASMIVLSNPSERADLARKLCDEGWKAIKLRLHHESLVDDIKTVQTVKDAVGDKMTIMVDANQAQSNGRYQPGVVWDYKRAVDTARILQDLGVYWLEEPLTRYDFKNLARLNDLVELQIAGGENNRVMNDFIQMAELNCYDVFQPESMVLDGITPLRKIGMLAELYGKRVIPHHGGGNIGVIAHMHLVASWDHAPFIELLHDPPVGHYKHKFAIFENAPLVENGIISVPDKPGLGVELNEDLILSR